MKNLIKLAIAATLALFSVNASAYLVSEVGDMDTLIGQTSGLTGEADEEAWIESIIFEDIIYTQLDSDSTGYSDGSLWEFVTDDSTLGTVAFDFAPYIYSEYYIIKVGNGGGTGTEDETYLYDNLASLQFAYINLSDFGPDVSLINIGVISHAGISVPEPGVIGLLAIGLLGIGIARRRTNV